MGLEDQEAKNIHIENLEAALNISKTNYLTSKTDLSKAEQVAKELKLLHEQEIESIQDIGAENRKQMLILQSELKELQVSKRLVFTQH